MSEIISITEGGRSRNFGPANLLETETTDGEGSCFWVPESERELESEYIIEDGDYESTKYAFSELHVSVSKPIGDFNITIDDYQLPHIDIDDPDIDLTIDPNTGLPDITIDDVEIDLPDISADIDINGDLDISLDLKNNELDISGLNMDGLDVNLDIDLDTLDIDVTDLPDEIRIMHVPTKTAYKDGEEIDLDGLVVQAYRGGEVWEDKTGKYIDGYVPAHELIYNPKAADITMCGVTSDLGVKVPKLKSSGYFKCVYSRWRSQDHSGLLSPFVTEYSDTFTTVFALSGRILWMAFPEQKVWRYNGKITDIEYRQRICAAATGGDNNAEKYTHNNKTVYFNRWYLGGIYKIDVLDSEHNLNEAVLQFETDFNLIKDENPDVKLYAWTALYGETNYGTITVGWPRPEDNKLLTASFDIFVENSEGGAGSGGTHHSGTWGDDSSGHFGGTTISGDYGGSHHSGKF